MTDSNNVPMGPPVNKVIRAPSLKRGKLEEPVGNRVDAPAYTQYHLDSLLFNRRIGCGAYGVVWAVTDLRDRRRMALKRLNNAFESLVYSKRAFLEIAMMCYFKHENVLSALDFIKPPDIDSFRDVYILTELFQGDLRNVIVSSRNLSEDHAKLFLYQILRGLMYLHSARIIHRDLKPNNILVNKNCALKICDFGMARVEEPDQSKHMTQDVVTQYYRAPEILMGAHHYTAAIDMWSVGCIFGELIGRKILFQAFNTAHQLRKITNLIGSPSVEDMQHACEGARAYMLRLPVQPSSFHTLYMHSPVVTTEAVNLISKMLVFNPDKRISVMDALAHPYLNGGRYRYHSCLCKCCYTTSDGDRHFTTYLEPIAPQPFDDHFVKELTSVQQVKEDMFKFLEEQKDPSRVAMAINHVHSSDSRVSLADCGGEVTADLDGCPDKN